MNTYQHTAPAGTKKRPAPGKKQALEDRVADGMSNSGLLQMLHADQPKPISPELRGRFEAGLGADFSNMRVSYATIPRELGFEAATRGRDILLDRRAGPDVMGHELAHAVQTAAGRVSPGGFPLVRDQAMEREADVLGSRAARGEAAGPEAAPAPAPIVPMSESAAPIQCHWLSDKSSGGGSGKGAEEGADGEDVVREVGGDAGGGGDVRLSAGGQGMSQDALQTARAGLRPIGAPPAGPEAAPQAETAPPAQDAAPQAETAPPAQDAAPQAEADQVDEALTTEGQPVITLRSAQGGGATLDVHEPPRSGAVQAALGEDVGKYPSYGKMLAALDTLAAILTMQKEIPASASRTMMEKLVGAYDTTIEAMRAYRREMGKFAWSRSGRAKRAARCSYVDDMIQSLTQDRDRISTDAQAGTDQGPAANQPQGEELLDQDFTNVIKGGAINQVYRYRQGYFKPSNGGNMSNNEQIYAQAIGLKFQDSQGQHIDPHMNDREIASSRLDKLLGGGVIGDAKKAFISTGSSLHGNVYHDSSRNTDRTFNAAQGQSGVLMEEAKGMAYTDYNWDFFGLDPSEDLYRMVYDSRRKDETLGDKIRPEEFMPRHLQGVDHAQSLATGNKQYLPEGQGTTLNAADPKLQRDMNALFILDTLSLQTDRHAGNFMIQADDQGNYSGLRAIDNDISFGESEAAFGKKLINYSGLPSEMLVDRDMANRVRSVTENELELTFSDLLTPGEIKALWGRFQKLSAYFDEMEKKGLLVSEWNDDTAKRQLLMGKGVGSDAKDYYSRHLLSLNMKFGTLKNI